MKPHSPAAAIRTITAAQQPMEWRRLASVAMMIMLLGATLLLFARMGGVDRPASMGSLGGPPPGNGS